MKRWILAVLSVAVLSAGCGGSGYSTSPVPGEGAGAAAAARKGFQTKLVRRDANGPPAPTPPPEVFQLVHYDGPLGKMAAYLTPNPNDGGKRPAILWIVGGDCNSIENVWGTAPASNDQTASAFRKAGIVMMFPSLRGGNDNPGAKEAFLGEVDDVLAAADFLAKQSYVDPARIYLGGHSTGGTLSLLTAECSNRFRAVFSFGPVEDIRGYGSPFHPFDTADPKEFELRAPGRWLESIESPTFVFEGAKQGNISSLRAMASSSVNPRVQFMAIPDLDHFSILAPTQRIIAQKILADSGPTCNITFAR